MGLNDLTKNHSALCENKEIAATIKIAESFQSDDSNMREKITQQLEQMEKITREIDMDTSTNAEIKIFTGTGDGGVGTPMRNSTLRNKQAE